MPEPIVQIPTKHAVALWAHLLQSDRGTEEVAFLFARYDGAAGSFRVADWYPVPPSGFLFCSAWHFELKHETQAGVIKRAHDLGTSLIEVHSHNDPGPPAFSPSDLHGFEEFVPHVLWRLKRPYAAVVVAHGGLDGLAWIDGPELPQRIDSINVDGRRRTASKRSQLRWTSWMNGYTHE